MNPFQKIFNAITNRIKQDERRLSIKQIGEYRSQIKKLYDEMEALTNTDLIDQMIEYQGIRNTAKEYNRLDKYYKDYYKAVFKALLESPNVGNNTKKEAIEAKRDWERAIEFVYEYLHKKQNRMYYGSNENLDGAGNEPAVDVYGDKVKEYPSNYYQADHQLGRYKKKQLSEQLDEGLWGVSLGSLSGAALAIIIRSLGLTFNIKPTAMVGVSTALGAIVGQYVQKHFFMDFTNYVKLKRYVEQEPDSYEVILDLMARNANKFQQKDPVKYQKILDNLERLKKNPPSYYGSSNWDEFETDYISDDPEFSQYLDDPEEDPRLVAYRDFISDKKRDKKYAEQEYYRNNLEGNSYKNTRAYKNREEDDVTPYSKSIIGYIDKHTEKQRQIKRKSLKSRRNYDKSDLRGTDLSKGL